ncbi:MAG: hypothetical protein MUC43_17505, partial [Pirellula sp.]|nr:hypothetical protein [Pirellula sp.]
AAANPASKRIFQPLSNFIEYSPTQKCDCIKPATYATRPNGRLRRVGYSRTPWNDQQIRTDPSRDAIPKI